VLSSEVRSILNLFGHAMFDDGPVRPLIALFAFVMVLGSASACLDGGVVMYHLPSLVQLWNNALWGSGACVG